MAIRSMANTDRTTRCLRPKDNPSLITWRRVRDPLSASGRLGGIQRRAIIAAMNETASTAYTIHKGKIEIIKPAIPGPTIWVVWKETCRTASAAGSLPGPTKLGRIAVRAGRSKASTAADAPVMRYMAQSGGASAKDKAASRPAVTMSPTCARAMIRRRSIRSAMAPESSETTIKGTTSTSPIMPTATTESVISNTW